MAKLILKIDGTPIPYISATISYSMDSLAHQFNAILPNNTTNLTSAATVKFYLDKQQIFSGFIDIVDRNITSNSNTIKIAGRSLTADMIDSTRTISYHQLTFSELTKRIAKTYNLNVISHATTQLIPEFTITAESPLQSLTQLAKQQNLILQETQQGIEIFNPAQLKNNNIKLELGKNISAANITHNWSKSYYHYEVRGYPLDSDTPAPQSIQLDTTIRRSRGKEWIADKLTDDKACQNRAKYEMNMATANSTTISLTVPQLHTELTGDAINKQIYFTAKHHDISNWYLTKSITINVTANKSDTQVQLINLPVQGL